jgi:transposase
MIQQETVRRPAWLGSTQTPGIPILDLISAFDEHEEEGTNIEVLAKRLKITPDEFSTLESKYHADIAMRRQAYETKHAKGTKTLAEKLKEVADMPKEEKAEIKVKPKAKVRRSLKKSKQGRQQTSPKTRKNIIADLKKGGSRAELAKKYGVLESKISNIAFRARRDGLLPPAGPIPKKKKSKPIEKEFKLESPPIRPSKSEKIEELVKSLKPSIEMYFEGDFLVIKLPKRDVTRTLLKDFI